MTRILLVMISAVSTLATNASGQSRLSFHRKGSPAPTKITWRHQAECGEAASEPCSGDRRSIVPSAPDIPRPLRPPAGVGLVLRSSGEIRVEQQVAKLPPRGRSPGARSESRAVERMSFETPWRISAAEPAFDAAVETDDEPVTLLHKVPQEISVRQAVEFDGAYPHVGYLPARFPYARKHCVNYPFAQDLWSGYCYERMIRYQHHGHHFGLCGCASCSCGNHAGCCGCSGACGADYDRPAEAPSDKRPMSRKVDTNEPAAVQPIHVYPRAPRNVPPPKHLLQPRRDAGRDQS